MLALSVFFHFETFLVSVNKRVHGGVHILPGYVCVEWLPSGCSTADWVSRAKGGAVNTEKGLKWFPSDHRKGHPGWAVLAHHLSPHVHTRLCIWAEECPTKDLFLTCLCHRNVSVANAC